jgi:hypothetical protein
MEIVEKKIRIDEEEEYSLDQYNVEDITELEDGTIFGTITSKFEIEALLPFFEYDEGQIKSCITNNCDDVCEYYDLGDGILSGGEAIPLIFKKVSGNIAQELLSGELFVVSTSIRKIDGINSLEREIENFQNDVESYSKNNIFILTNGFYEADDKEINGIFTVSDMFKSLYSKKTLPKKDELISVLKSIKNQGQVRFKEKLQEYISEVQGIAQTENEIYDFDYNSQSAKRK